MGFVAPPKDWIWGSSMSIGPVWESAGKTQTFYLATDIIKTYVASNATHALVDGEVFVEIQYALGEREFSGGNDAHGFKNTPLSTQAVTMPNFGTHTEMSFTYPLEPGIQNALNPYWQVGTGYEFADWGQRQLNSASGQTLNSGLNINHLNTNGVLFNLTYLA